MACKLTPRVRLVWESNTRTACWRLPLQVILLEERYGARLPWLPLITVNGDTVNLVVVRFMESLRTVLVIWNRAGYLTATQYVFQFWRSARCQRVRSVKRKPCSLFYISMGTWPQRPDSLRSTWKCLEAFKCCTLWMLDGKLIYLSEYFGFNDEFWK